MCDILFVLVYCYSLVVLFNVGPHQPLAAILPSNLRCNTPSLTFVDLRISRIGCGLLQTFAQAIHSDSDFKTPQTQTVWVVYWKVFLETSMD